MKSKKTSTTKQILFYILGAIVYFAKLLWNCLYSILNATTNFYLRIVEKLSHKFGYLWSWIVVVLSTLLIICGISLAIISFVNAYDNEMNRLKQEKLAEEERQRIAAEEEAKRILEETRKWALEKEVEVVNNLKAMGLAYKRLDVPILYQHPEYPSACECLALTNMMNYYGFGLSKGELVENYLIYDEDDWVNYYVGTPYDGDYGGIMMCPGVKNLFDSYIYSNQAPFKGFDVTGREFEDLFAYIERGHPVQIWSSLNMDDLGEPTSTMDNYNVYWFTHSVLITGFDKDNEIVYVADSINGNCYYSIERVKEIFLKQNSQAFVMISQDELNHWIYNQDWSYDDTIPKVNPEDENCEDESENED